MKAREGRAINRPGDSTLPSNITDSMANCANGERYSIDCENKIMQYVVIGVFMTEGIIKLFQVKSIIETHLMIRKYVILLEVR